MVAKADDAVASAPAKIRLFLDADWLISSRSQPQAKQTKWDSLSIQTYVPCANTHTDAL